MNRGYQLTAAILYVALFFLLFPVYRYVLDVDGISYINVAKRVAAGEFYFSVNGYWAPLSSWLLVPFIQNGFDPVLAAKYLNGFIGFITLYSCYSLFDKFTIHHLLKKILPFVLAVLMLSYCFYELCADLLQLFLLTVYLNLILGKGFIRSNVALLIAGVIGALCYYAKAYSLPFFILHFAITVFVLLRNENVANLKTAFVKKTIIGLLAFFIAVGPYVLVLSQKYGSVRFNHAGKVNTSWMLSPGSSDTRRIAIEPPFHNATSYWDEPYYAQQKWVSPFTSVDYFLKEMKWTFSNTIKFSGLLNEISIFSFLILIGFTVHLYRKRKDVDPNNFLLLLTTLVFPSGYLLIFIEWRYIWLLPILLLLMAAILITLLYEKGYLSKRLLITVAISIAFSFLYQPLMELKKQQYANKDAYEIAAVFKQHNIRGKFLLHNTSSALNGKFMRVSYLTKSKFYGTVVSDYNFDEFMQTAKQFNINYYIFCYDIPMEKDNFLQSDYVKNAVRVFTDVHPGIIVLKLK